MDALTTVNLQAVTILSASAANIKSFVVKKITLQCERVSLEVPIKVKISSQITVTEVQHAQCCINMIYRYQSMYGPTIVKKKTRKGVHFRYTSSNHHCKEQSSNVFFLPF
jgi:hypothetical protein